MDTGRFVTIPSRIKFSNSGKILYKQPSIRLSHRFSNPYQKIAFFSRSGHIVGKSANRLLKLIHITS